MLSFKPCVVALLRLLMGLMEIKYFSTLNCKFYIIGVGFRMHCIREILKYADGVGLGSEVNRLDGTNRKRASLKQS